MPTPTNTKHPAAGQGRFATATRPMLVLQNRRRYKQQLRIASIIYSAAHNCRRFSTYASEPAAHNSSLATICCSQLPLIFEFALPNAHSRAQALYAICLYAMGASEKVRTQCWHTAAKCLPNSPRNARGSPQNYLELSPQAGLLGIATKCLRANHLLCPRPQFPAEINATRDNDPPNMALEIYCAKSPATRQGSDCWLLTTGC